MGFHRFSLFINQGSKMLTTSVGRYLIDSLAYFHDKEMQGAKHVFRKKAKMASIALVLEVYSEKTNIH